MSAFALKLFAVLVMVVDHVGAVLDYGVNMHNVGVSVTTFWAMRAIGRMAFPVFAFLIAQGCAHTRDIKRYMARLAIFALLSQPFYWLLWRPTRSFNVMLTLLAGAFAIFCWQRLWAAPKGARQWGIPVRLLCVAGMVAAEAVAVALEGEFAHFGVVAILVFYILRPKGEDDPDGALPGRLWLSVLAGMACLAVQAVLMGYDFIYILAVLAASVPLLLYSGKPGPRRGKWFFYVFYPAHIALLWGVKLLFQAGIWAIYP